MAVNAAMKELGRQEAVAAALGAYEEFSKNYDVAVKGAMGEYDRIQEAYKAASGEYDKLNAAITMAQNLMLNSQSNEGLMTNVSGKTVSEVKQTDQNFNLGDIAGRPCATIGCKLTSFSAIMSFLTGDDIAPSVMNQVAKGEKAFDGNGSFYSYKVAELYGYKENAIFLQGVKNGENSNFTTDDLRNQIDLNLANSNPTMLRYGDGNNTHYVVIAGAKYDENNAITQYLVRDVGTSNPRAQFIDRNAMRANDNLRNGITNQLFHWSGQRVTGIYWYTPRNR